LPLLLASGAARCAIGFHYPSDMVEGALLGIVIGGATMLLYQARVLKPAPWLATAKSFDLSNFPVCFLSYALLVLLAVEFGSHFQHVFDLVFAVRGEFLANHR
jgi:hypothetical protein